MKDNDCKVSSDNAEVAECVEIEKRCQISCIRKAKICNFVYFRKGLLYIKLTPVRRWLKPLSSKPC